jgi:hypothetical protein
MAGTNFQTAAGAWSSSNVLATANQFNFMGTVGNVFELFDVNLVEGSFAVPFVLPDFISELILCQRYFEKSYDYYVRHGTAISNGMVGVGSPTGTGITNFYPAVFFKVKKRTMPTMSMWSGTGVANQFSTVIGGSNSFPTVGVVNVTDNGFILANSGTATAAGVFCHYVADARMV